MKTYLLVALIAIAGVGYVVVDELSFADPNVPECCANGFDASPYETTPVQP